MRRIVMSALFVALIFTPGTAAPAGGRQASGEIPILVAPVAWPGKVLVSHDEWILSDFGFIVAPDTYRFALNVAAWLADGRPGRFLAYSDNFALMGNALANTMQSAGHEWAVDTSIPFTITNLLKYDAVFLAGNAVDNEVLIDYVRLGGGVYIAGGTGWYGAITEVSQWSAFLNAFGLRFLPYYDYSWWGYLTVGSASPLFAGVTGLFHIHGNPIELLDSAPPGSTIVDAFNGHAILAAYGAPAIPVSVDINPGQCPNRLITEAQKTFRVVIAGRPTMDVSRIDDRAVRLVGVPPLRVERRDVATAGEPKLGKADPLGCLPEAPDGYTDLIFTFDSNDVVSSIETLLGRPVQSGELLAVSLAGLLHGERVAAPIVGWDVLVVYRRK